MSRLRWPDSTNSVSDVPGTIQTKELRRLVLKTTRSISSMTLRSIWTHSSPLMRRYRYSSGRGFWQLMGQSLRGRRRNFLTLAQCSPMRMVMLTELS